MPVTAVRFTATTLERAWGEAEPLAYLRDGLSRLPSMTNQDDLGPLLPSSWQPRS